MDIFNLNEKVFQSTLNSGNGEVSSKTMFFYSQDGDIVRADYSGGLIVEGHLLGKFVAGDKFEFAYHHINKSGKVMIGQGCSVLEVLLDGRIKLKEIWQWLVGDKSVGFSEGYLAKLSFNLISLSLRKIKYSHMLNMLRFYFSMPLELKLKL